MNTFTLINGTYYEDLEPGVRRLIWQADHGYWVIDGFGGWPTAEDAINAAAAGAFA